MTRPNILLIHSDQHRFDCVGVNGHPLLQTPNIDRLAAGGMNFTHAFCPIPVCVPVRNSLLSGQWATRHLAISNWDTEAPRPASEDLPTFSRTLCDAGYTLGYVAKWHVHPECTSLDYGFHDYVPEADYGHWRADSGLPPQPRHNGWLGELDPDIDPDASRLAWGADHTIRLLERYALHNAPFFLRWDPPSRISRTLSLSRTSRAIRPPPSRPGRVFRIRSPASHTSRASSGAAGGSMAGTGSSGHRSSAATSARLACSMPRSVVSWTRSTGSRSRTRPW